MLRYLGRQLLNMAMTLLVVSFLVFALNELSPGDVARKMLGPYATQDQVDQLNQEMGLDRPLLVRYCEYMERCAARRLRRVDRLSPAGLRSALGPARQHAAAGGHLLRSDRSLLGAVRRARRHAGAQRHRPLRLGVLLDLRVDPGVRHGRVPAGDLRRLARRPARNLAPALRRRLADLDQFVLPVLVVTLYDAGYLISMIRASMVEVMRQPYIRTAMLKGMPLPATSSPSMRCATR